MMKFGEAATIRVGCLCRYFNHYKVIGLYQKHDPDSVEGSEIVMAHSPVTLGGRRNGQRGRPRKWDEAEGIIGNMLHIRRVDEGETVVLHLSGTLDLSTQLRLREVAFTIIGERPRRFCLDLCAIAHIEIAGINTLVTIGRVARLVKVSFFIIPPASLRQTLMDTGLIRMLPFETEPNPLTFSSQNDTPGSEKTSQSAVPA